MYFFLALCIMASMMLNAQNVVFSDNFDSYAAGTHLAQSNSAWTTWSNAPGGSEDGTISSSQSASAPNSLYITGANDQVYPFGNYTSGHYTLTFNYYVPSSGNGAYFNIQHILLQQWALECYFNNNGTGYLSVGGSEYNFTYPSNAWFPMEFDVDMDNDQASLTINNVLVHTWPFSYQQANINGVNQLAGINFYAGAPNNASGTYYVDDFVVTEVSAALIGEFDVTPDDLIFTIPPQSTGSQTLTMSNPGSGGTDYYVVATYDIPSPNPTPTGETNLQYYLGDPYTSVGWNGGPTEVELAVGIPSANLQQHIGKTLNEIHFFMNQALPTAKVCIYKMNNSLLHPGPGAVVYEQTFVPDSGWNSIQLTTPYVIDGGDLWFGVQLTQPEGAYLAPLDGALANDYSCWYKIGSTWYNRFTGSSYDYNLCLGGKIDGTPISPWLSVTPSNGHINANGSQEVTVTANTNNMSNNEACTAKLHCYSSDIENSEVVIPVTLSVTIDGIDDHNLINITLYPNPAVDNLNITSEQIETVEIYNMEGRMIYSGKHAGDQVTIPTDNFAAGMYTVKVTTATQTVSQKVVIR